MFKKKILSVLSAAAVAASMAVGTGNTALALKDTGLSGTYTQGSTIKTFLNTDYEGYGSVELGYEYLTLPDQPSATFGLIAFDTDWNGWTTTSVGQPNNPEVNVDYTSIVTIDQIENSLNTGKEALGFNLVTDNFGSGEVKLNYVKFNDKQGKEATITGSWTKGTASEMTVTGDTDINVDANPYNIYVSGFSGYGFTNPTVDVTVTYDNNIGEDLYKQACLYYVDGYQTADEAWTPVEELEYKKAEAGQTVTYSFNVEPTRHSFFACFDACTVNEIKVYDKVPSDVTITGNWTMGTESEMFSSDYKVNVNGGTENIAISSLPFDRYFNPTIEVTANYAGTFENVRAEVYSGNDKVAGDYVEVNEVGEKVYTYELSTALTAINLYFSDCTVTQIRIYDNRSADITEINNRTASQLTSMMGKAWNLGNALDSTKNGTVGETLWNNPTVNKSLFELVKDSGFDTVRIPVSFMDKIGSAESGYAIDTAWMNRIKTVVDYALDSGLYVIMDMHHDGSKDVTGKWIDISLPEGTQRTAMLNKFSAVWTQIAETFADYDQHLVFESMNEVMIGESYGYTSSLAYENINALNQTFVNAVRSVDGNSDRCLLIPGYNTNIDLTISGLFKKPTDTTANRLMLSVHYYDPYDFTLNEQGTSTWGSSEEIAYLKSQMQKISAFANGLNMPVIIGEYGAVNKENDFNRIIYLSALNRTAETYNIVTAYWDNGYTGQYGFALFDRNSNMIIESGTELINAIMNK
ncbi:MAG: glycoside hydrolase family 5 protein [Oscillospiraceae bacterium]